MEKLENILDSLHLEDLKNETHPSVFDTNEVYSMLIIRLPVISKELSGKSLGFVFTKDKSYLYNKEKKIFEQLDDIFIGPYTILDKLIDKLLKSFLQYQESISDMEEGLYANNIEDSFLNNWLTIKLDILRIERILLRGESVVDEFIALHKEDSNFPMNHYIDIHEHIERTMRSATLQLSKLDYLYSFYNAKSSDKMNRMVYLLTIISAIFLPLNLAVGFFGMNTSGLPFTSGSMGTYYVVSIIITLVIVTSAVVFKWGKK